VASLGRLHAAFCSVNLIKLLKMALFDSLRGTIEQMNNLSNGEVQEELRKVAAGDERAATALYRNYFDFLYAYVRHKLAQDAAAEEVTQDVFVAAFKKPESYSGDSKFTTWLCGIANFKVADWWRKNGRDWALESLDDEELPQQEDAQADFTLDVEAAQDTEAMRFCIDRLKPLHREVIFQVYFEEQGVANVASLLDCPVGTVQTRLFYARKLLRTCMDNWISGGRHG
jgi:RNA polymerase sigma-70 factor, ECF subfamily